MFGANFSLFGHVCPGALDLELGHGTGPTFWLPLPCFLAEQLKKPVLKSVGITSRNYIIEE